MTVRAFWRFPLAPLLPILSVLILLFLSNNLFAPASAASPPIVPGAGALLAARTCTRAARIDPNVKAPFCARALKESWLLSSAPGPVGSKTKTRRPFPQTLHGIVELSVFSALVNATRSTAAIHRLMLPNGKIAASGDRQAMACVKDCLEIYSGAVDLLKDSVGAVRDGRFNDATAWIGAALDAPGTCDDGLMELAGRRKGGGRKWNPLRRNSKDLYQLSAMSLTFVSFLH